MIEPRPAATVMILREREAGIEVFMLRRSSGSAFMPDVFVFPGGAVDAEDERLAGLAGLAPDNAAYVYAAIRETFEESGLLFAANAVAPGALAIARRRLLDRTRTFAHILLELNTAVVPDALHYFSRWVTPPGETRRFDTRFFAARAPAGQIAQADASETHDGTWIAPDHALARYAAGEFALIFPTVKHLERIAAFSDVDALLDFAKYKKIVPVMPELAQDAAFALPPDIEGAW